MPSKHKASDGRRLTLFIRHDVYTALEVEAFQQDCSMADLCETKLAVPLRTLDQLKRLNLDIRPLPPCA